MTLLHELTKLTGKSTRQLAHYFTVQWKLLWDYWCYTENSAKTPSSSLRASIVSLKAICCPYSTRQAREKKGLEMYSHTKQGLRNSHFQTRLLKSLLPLTCILGCLPMPICLKWHSAILKLL